MNIDELRVVAPWLCANVSEEHTASRRSFIFCWMITGLRRLNWDTVRWPWMITRKECGRGSVSASYLTERIKENHGKRHFFPRKNSNMVTPEYESVVQNVHWRSWMHSTVIFRLPAATAWLNAKRYKILPKQVSFHENNIINLSSAYYSRSCRQPQSERCDQLYQTAL